MYTSVLNSGRVSSWDKAGMATSMLCILHCILTPLLAASLPILAATEQGTHIGLTLALMMIGLLAFIPGYRKHGRRSMVLLGVIGFTLLCSAVILPEGISSEAVEMALTMIGGGFLIVAHMSNLYFCKACSVCGQRPCVAARSLR